jgi:hypothetical protein
MHDDEWLVCTYTCFSCLHVPFNYRSHLHFKYQEIDALQASSVGESGTCHPCGANPMAWDPVGCKVCH